MAFIAVFLMSVSISMRSAQADTECRTLLSGESPELTAAIYDLAKLRYELDVAMSQGDSSAMRRAMQDAYEKKEAEIIRSAGISSEQLIARMRAEVKSIQKESNTKEARRNEGKTEEQKELQKVKLAEERALKTGTFAKIPAGTFMMGRATANRRTLDNKHHQVTLTQNYEMQTTVVTQRQYLEVMGKNPNPSYFKDKEYCPDTWEAEIGCPDYPVEMVSWEDAQAFIQKLNEIDDGYFYRLPTEAEWEYAARAGTTTRYYWGDLMDDDYAWHPGNSGKQTHQVGQKKPNAFGLYDMVGNVWEWVNDWDGDYPSSVAIDPQGPATGTYRTVRGESWRYLLNAERLGSRNTGVPTGYTSSYGFRLVRIPRPK